VVVLIFLPSVQNSVTQQPRMCLPKQATVNVFFAEEVLVQMS
jgi:hypothetical protein